MSSADKKIIQRICKDSHNDPGRLMDIVIAVQDKYRHVSQDAMELIAHELKIQPISVRSLVSFYSYFSETPKGEVIIRLCNDPVDKMMGADVVADTLKKELGINFGETTPDGRFSLEWTACMGMSDQVPAALVNEVVVTKLTPNAVKKMVQALKTNPDPKKLVDNPGDGHNADPLVGAMVENNIKKKGDVLFAEHQAESGLKKALSMQPEEIINEVKEARLRGRGGAGFPVGMKWEYTRASAGEAKYILCNADEGEPGTFKDRVLLTEKPDLLFEGMTIEGYAVGAEGGIIYLRAEYTYLKSYLESVLKKRRDAGLLGKNILKKGFNFDIKIQMGGGAYICGEESALISSCEGLPGDPKTRPPFPVQKGYKESPTSVNNVETMSCVPHIMVKGGAWFGKLGSEGSAGTKLLSISGDCKTPGVYEFPFGVKIKDVLKAAGAENTQAVLVGGPSGQFINPDMFDRTICYEDLATGGAFIVFGQNRDLLSIADEYMEFFIDESCGYCTPCRAGNVILKKRLVDILSDRGEPADLDYLNSLGTTVKKTSRCGLGQTSPNPIMTTIKNFKGLYDAKVKVREKGMQPNFDIHAALKEHEGLAKRKSEIFK